MKKCDKEFLCYLICLSWDRLDDQERIRASRIIHEIVDKEDNLPDVPTPENMTAEKLKDFESSEEKSYSNGDTEPERRGGPPDKVFHYNEGYCL